MIKAHTILHGIDTPQDLVDTMAKDEVKIINIVNRNGEKKEFVFLTKAWTLDKNIKLL